MARDLQETHLAKDVWSREGLSTQWWTTVWLAEWFKPSNYVIDAREKARPRDAFTGSRPDVFPRPLKVESTTARLYGRCKVCKNSFIGLNYSKNENAAATSPRQHSQSFVPPPLPPHLIPLKPAVYSIEVMRMCNKASEIFVAILK